MNKKKKAKKLEKVGDNYYVEEEVCPDCGQLHTYKVEVEEYVVINKPKKRIVN